MWFQKTDPFTYTDVYVTYTDVDYGASADIYFSFNWDEREIAENSVRLPFADPATRHNMIYLLS